MELHFVLCPASAKHIPYETDNRIFAQEIIYAMVQRYHFTTLTDLHCEIIAHNYAESILQGQPRLPRGNRAKASTMGRPSSFPLPTFTPPISASIARIYAKIRHIKKCSNRRARGVTTTWDNKGVGWGEWQARSQPLENTAVILYHHERSRTFCSYSTWN